MTLSALLFDVDGTLADTEETHRQAWQHGRSTPLTGHPADLPM